ncbi:S9 family peptidase [Acidobacteriota bacterium]
MRLPFFNNFKWSAVILLALLAAGCGGTAPASLDGDPSLLTVERIYDSSDFSAGRFGPARWLEDGSGYTTLESSEKVEGGRDIVLYDPESGEGQILIPTEQLIPDGEERPLRISDYIWSDDSQKMLIFTNTKRVWRRNTRGDYWVLNRGTGELKKMGARFESSTLMFAKFSPDGTRVAYVMKNNIYVEDINGGRIIPVTRDGSETIINGTSDWVYEEEFGVRDGFRWSPDGRQIAYWQLDSSGIPEFHMINNTDSLYPKITTFKHPKVGQTNSACKVGVVSAAGGRTQWFDFPDSRNNYIARLEWAANSDEIVFQRLNRLQNTNWLYLGNIHTGEMTNIFTDKDEAWVEVVDDFLWMDDGKYFTWVSERDGWNHAYLISRDGKEITCLTPGEYDVINIQKIDLAGGWMYFIASPDNPTQSYLHRVPLDGSGKLERLTPQDQPGSHGYQISQDAKWAFHTYSSFGISQIRTLVGLPGHEDVRTLVDNTELQAKVDALRKSPVEFFKVDIGEGIELDAWCMKPPDFDASKKYPLFFYIYGEPASSTVRDSWGGSTYLWHLMLTQKGYVVMSVDPRGTRMPKGREWRKSIYRQIGILASQDHAAACRKILADRPYIDPARIGIWGWSGGGQMSLNMLFRYPDLYNTALAIAFVSDQLLYDTIYQERYMGLPDDNAEGYRLGSPITFTSQLEGNLFIAHGTGDDNVHYQSFERLVNELIKNNKHFTMMSYPNRSHGIREGENTTLHLRTLLTRYLMENMPPGPGK